MARKAYAGVINCTVTDNVAANFGAGVLVHWNSTLIIDGGLIDNNDVSVSPTFGYGGGIYTASGAKLEINNGTTISNNNAKYGAGGRIEYSTITDINDGTNFHENHAISSDGGLYFGAGTYLGTETINVGLITIEENTAKFGAGIDVGRGFAWTSTGTQIINNISETSGGAIYTHPQNTITLSGCQINGNSAQYGGAIYVNSAENLGNATTVTLNDSTIDNNSAAVVAQNGQGGAIIAFNDNVLNSDSSIISNNTATRSGGELYLLTRTVGTFIGNTQIAFNHTDTSGGGVYLSANTVLNIGGGSSIHNNDAVEYGGGIAGAQDQSITLSDNDSINK